MYRVMVITNWERMAALVNRQLADLLGDFIDTGYMSIERGINSIIRADLVLVSTTKVASYINKYITAKTHILVMKRSITKSGFEKLMELPRNVQALLVNDLQESAYDTIAMLYEIGVKHIDLIPYYPGCKADGNQLKMAITPNEVALVPDTVNEIVNIGDRVLDASTIIDILCKLDILNKKTTQILINYINNTIPRNPELLSSLSYVMESKQHLELILDVVNEGIIAFDDDNKIIIINKLAEKIFQDNPWNVKGMVLKDFFSPGLDKLYSYDELKDEAFSIGGILYVINKYPLFRKGQAMGGVITLKECTEIERLEQKIRQHTRRMGYVAKYTFNDIIGKSEETSRTVALALRMARGDGVVLIEGESGTGKEYFAQAIHNSSMRKQNPFVAFNCAAVPETLIESELLGYEEGAFTGAKKGGKPGLFELAHRGTIFLDEIGDISKNMQAKLLRVLQEREVVRIGGTLVKPIDVRIIAATNHNLMELVAGGEFRKDLYYRLNILLLRLPPLRDRRDDIPCLIKHFLEKHSARQIILQEVLEALQSYSWPGNVRELENCIEYLVSTSDNCISLKDLPLGILEGIQGTPVIYGYPDELTTLGDPHEMMLILKTIKDAHATGQKIGRREISRRLADRKLYLTEQEIRSRLKKLEEYHYVHISRGRAGTKLTTKGSRVAIHSEALCLPISDSRSSF